MAKFDDFIDALKSELKLFAEEQFKNFKDAALKAGSAFIKECEADLKRWTKALAKGDLVKGDFEWLLESKKDLFELNTLKQIGLSKVATSRFINGVIDLIVDTAFKVFLK